MKLFSREYGKGDPLIILHGLFGLSDNWATHGRSLGEFFHVMIPDLRNHGQSPHSDVFDYPSMKEDILEFIEEKGSGEVNLLGHSLGGKVAMMLALENPQIVKKLIVADISPGSYPPNLEHLQLLNAMLSTDLSIATSRSDIELQLATKIKSQRLRQFLLKNIYRAERGRFEWRLNLPAISANLPLVMEGIETAGIYPGPALFIRGGKSDYIKENEFEKIRDRFPNAILKTIENAGHWLHADAPAEFLEIVLAFLNVKTEDR